jgi:hypothetical protein
MRFATLARDPQPASRNSRGQIPRIGALGGGVMREISVVQAPPMRQLPKAAC